MKPMDTALEIMKQEYNAIGPKWRFKTDEHIPCPFHPNEVKPKPTFKYFQKDMRYFCSACEHGSISDFVQQVKKLDGADTKMYLKQVYQYAEKPRKKLVSNVVKSEMPEDESLFLPQIVNIAYENLKPDSPAYKLLLKQGISPKTIKQEKIGYFGSTAKDIAHLLRDFPKKELYRLGILTHKKNTPDDASPFEGKVIVPLYHNGFVVDLRGDSFQGKNVSLLIQSSLPIALGSKVELSKEMVIIAKGLTDYLTLIENGLIGKLIDADHDAFQQIFVCLDSSPSGRNKAMKIARRILEETKIGIDSVKIILLPEGKDINALFLDHKAGFQK